MKLRMVDRVMIAAAAVVLIVLCGAIIAEAFFNVPVLAKFSTAMQGQKIIAYVIMTVLVFLSVCFLMMLIRRRGKRGFVMQDTEGGDLSIALQAVDGLVQQCVAVHEEMQLVSSSVKCNRDGVTVNIRIMMANGVSVPLAIDALQKQIRQYVTSCTGVNVEDMHVQVDAMDGTPVQTPYSVPAMLQAAVPALNHTDETVSVQEEKALHQRLFSDEVPQEQPQEPAQPEDIPKTDLPAVPEADQAEIEQEDAFEPDDDWAVEPDAAPDADFEWVTEETEAGVDICFEETADDADDVTDAEPAVGQQDDQPEEETNALAE